MHTKTFELSIPNQSGRNQKTMKFCQILTPDVLIPLHQTPWFKGIHQVSGEALSHALHGWIQPLLRELGPEPRQTCKRIPESIGLCAMYKDCINAQKTCQPKYIATLPDCYEAQIDDPNLILLLSEIVHQWSKDVFVIVTMDEEFVL